MYCSVTGERWCASVSAASRGWPLVDLKKGTGRELDLPYVEFSHLTRVDSQHVAAIVGAAKSLASIVSIDIASGKATTLRTAGESPLHSDSISIAVPIDFPSAHGRTAHAFYYAPTNPRYRAVPGTLPPLLALVHGGPTSQASPALRSSVQFWTSRGIAVVDVNYGGSSGYGRAYRQLLNGNWGVVDVEDVIAAVRFLVGTQRADAMRTAISGGSAGGYTVLVALSTSDVFHAGTDRFGVSDMTALARDTHKFESRYVDSLIGPLPEAQAIYDSRSPLNHLDGFKVPVLVLQGADDPVVPPNQSQRIVDALRARHVPVAYILYPGESHGFRKPETIINSLQAELAFYGHIFGFKPADQLPPLTIEGLAPRSLRRRGGAGRVRHAASQKPCLDHGIDRLGCLLLHPMGYVGQIAQRQIADVFLRCRKSVLCRAPNRPLPRS